MYSSNHSYFRLCLQRFLCSYRCFVTILTVFLFSIFFYYYNESLAMLKMQEVHVSQCQQKLESFSAQLQVVYEHKSRLEKAIAADRDACNKRLDTMSTNLRFAKDSFAKTDTELKALQKKEIELQKQLIDLKAQKTVASTVDIEKAKEVYTKEIEELKSENAKLNARLVDLNTAMNTGNERVHQLQQRQTVRIVQEPAVNTPVAPVSLPPPSVVVNQPAIAAPAVQAHGGGGVIPPPPAQTPIPQAAKVVPIADQQQQQQQQQAPVEGQLQQPGPPATPSPVQRPQEGGKQLPVVVPQNVLLPPAAPSALPLLPPAPILSVTTSLNPAPAPSGGLQQQAPAPPPAPIVDIVIQQRNDSRSGGDHHSAPAAKPQVPADVEREP